MKDTSLRSAGLIDDKGLYSFLSLARTGVYKKGWFIRSWGGGGGVLEVVGLIEDIRYVKIVLVNPHFPWVFPVVCS